MLKIDGNHGEAGGQIVRTALAFSTLTNTPFWIKDIRQNRPKPGLKAQHLNCVKALEKFCNAKPKLALLGSEELFFTPNKISGGTIEIDIGTAGSITLLLQSIILPALFSDKRTIIKITGGTDVSWSPSFDYFANVLIPHVKRFADIDVKLERRGYYPKGNGKVMIKIYPRWKIYDHDSFAEFQSFLKDKFLPMDLTEQGELVQVRGVSHASTDLEDARVAERQAESASLELSSLGCPVNIRSEYVNTDSTGSGITLWAQFSKGDAEFPVIIGSDRLGEKGVRAETVGIDAAKNLLEEIDSGACVDKRLADQLIPFLSLVRAKFKTSELTPHTLTNAWTIKHFLGDIFKIDSLNNTISIN